MADLRLVRDVLAGAPGAVDAFVGRMRCVPRILASRNKQAGRPLSADELEDLAQDVLQLVWSKLAEYQGDAAIETWVYRFCHLTLLNRTREVRRRRAAEASSPTEPAADLAETLAQADADLIMVAFHSLFAVDRRLIEQKLLAGRSFTELGQAMDQSPNTLKTRYYRILEKLKKALDQAFGGGHE